MRVVLPPPRPLPLAPKSGLPDFGIFSRPKSDKSDFGWRERESVDVPAHPVHAGADRIQYGRFPAAASTEGLAMPSLLTLLCVATVVVTASVALAQAPLHIARQGSV